MSNKLGNIPCRRKAMQRSRALISLSLLLAVAPIAAQARKPHAKHTSGNASNALISQFRKYYAIQDSGWPIADVSRMMYRTTADYYWTTQDGKAASRDQMIDSYSGMLKIAAEKGATIHVKTTVLSVKLSGNTAVVLANQKGNATGQMDAGDGDTASRLVQAGGFRIRDTWVHLEQGWYLARTEDATMDASLSVKDHVNE